VTVTRQFFTRAYNNPPIAGQWHCGQLPCAALPPILSMMTQYFA